MASINASSGASSISPAELAKMDIETALMAVQTNRANALESQLKDQMEAVRGRNEQINALNDILAQVRAVRPAGDSTKTANTSSGGSVQVPVTSTTPVVDQVALAAAKAKLGELQDLKAGKVTTTAPTTPDQLPYATALEVYTDLKGAPLPANLTAVERYQQLFVGREGLGKEFAAYCKDNSAYFDGKLGAKLSSALATATSAAAVSNLMGMLPGIADEFERFLLLSVQGGGKAPPPSTPVSVTCSSTQVRTTSKATAIPQDIDAQIKAQTDQITALTKGTLSADTTFKSMTLNAALAAYGFQSGSLSQTQFDQLIQTISSRIDGLNSTQQLDMLRLQSLTNKRNESFDIMTNFLKKMQDNRSSIVGNLR